MLLLPTLLLYALGLLLTGIGSRLASRCATWCGALCGLPMWMVGGTLVAVCTALPQLVLAFLAAGMSVTALAVGTALAGAVTQLGLVLALCLLRCNVTVDRGELLRKCALLLEGMERAMLCLSCRASPTSTALRSGRGWSLSLSRRKKAKSPRRKTHPGGPFCSRL